MTSYFPCWLFLAIRSGQTKQHLQLSVLHLRPGGMKPPRGSMVGNVPPYRGETRASCMPAWVASVLMASISSPQLFVQTLILSNFLLSFTFITLS
jgi:hypothetical protein